MGRRDEYEDDDRYVVIDRDEGSSLGTFVLGLAIGAGAALLFAPMSGAETRARITTEAQRARRRVRDMADELSNEVVGRMEDARAAIDDGVSRARGEVQSRVRAVGDAVNAGRSAASQARTEMERAVAESKRAYADARRAAREMREAADGDEHADTADARETRVTREPRESREPREPREPRRGRDAGATGRSAMTDDLSETDSGGTPGEG